MAAALVAGATGCSSGGSEASTPTPGPTSATSRTTTTLPLRDRPPRERIQHRLARELDATTAKAVVAGMDQARIDGIVGMTKGDIEASPWLDYTPSRAPDADIDSLWVFSYGFRIVPGTGIDGVEVGGKVPPMDQLVPGPTNEALAKAAATFVAEHPVPVVAQWEVARVLGEMGVPNVISVEPDVAPDGTVTYLSTAGVVDKGKRLLADAGKQPGHAGVLCFADHAVRCLMTARQAGLTADVPKGAALPSTYDPKSGQRWTRSRQAWVPVDLLGRSVLAAQG